MGMSFDVRDHYIVLTNLPFNTGLRSYAGVPLTYRGQGQFQGSYNIGSLCLCTMKPLQEELTIRQRSALQHLSDLIVADLSSCATRVRVRLVFGALQFIC